MVTMGLFITKDQAQMKIKLICVITMICSQPVHHAVSGLKKKQKKMAV